MWEISELQVGSLKQCLEYYVLLSLSLYVDYLKLFSSTFCCIVEQFQGICQILQWLQTRLPALDQQPYHLLQNMFLLHYVRPFHNLHPDHCFQVKRIVLNLLIMAESQRSINFEPRSISDQQKLNEFCTFTLVSQNGEFQTNAQKRVVRGKECTITKKKPSACPKAQDGHQAKK